MSINATASVSTADVPLLCNDIHRYLGEAESRVHVLRGVSLQLRSGCVHAIVGPSGCGKSSLLYVMGLLDRPDGGRIVLGGEAVEGLTDDQVSRRRNEHIGFVFQFHFLMHEFTAQENVMIPMRRLGRLNTREMEERAAMLLEMVGLGDKIHRNSQHLSGGEQQRVAIARSLANDPQVLLADEPTGNLDTASSERVFHLLTELVRRQRKALLLVTHNPQVAGASDWIHEMKDGQLIECSAGRPR
ncbi:MAG: ABC transporter ATP-binding protein [Verrucomicrobiia bacterium]